MCGGALTTLPVAAYPEGDVLLFNELLTLCEGAGIAGLEAEQLAGTLQSARAVSEREALSVATFGLPGLLPLAPLLAANPGRLRQALSMLDTILRAVSKAQRASGIVRRPLPSASPTTIEAATEWQSVGALSRTWRDDGRGG